MRYHGIDDDPSDADYTIEAWNEVYLRRLRMDVTVTSREGGRRPPRSRETPVISRGAGR